MKEYLVGFRKFTMAVAFLVVAIILLIAGVIPSDDWLKQVSAVMIAFMGTNIGEHIIQVGKDWIANRKWENMKEVMKDVEK